MRPKRKDTSKPLDEDDVPELSAAWFDRAAVYKDGKLIRPAKRGRPALEQPKQQVTLRLDADVVRDFRAMGSGWQTKINDALKRSLQRKKHALPTSKRKVTG